MSALRLLVADDHDVVRAGMKSLLEEEPGWVVVAEAGNGREAIERAEELRPDVAVLDVTMPELNGLEAARQIRKSCPETEILILTVHETEIVAQQVLETGAKGYILKSDAGKELVAAVKNVSNHLKYITTRVAQMVPDAKLKEGMQAIDADDIGTRLTPREREIETMTAKTAAPSATAQASVDALRDATLAALDGSLALQQEITQAALDAWKRSQSEMQRLAEAQGKALEEGFAAQRRAAEKSAGWLREQVERATRQA